MMIWQGPAIPDGKVELIPGTTICRRQDLGKTLISGAFRKAIDSLAMPVPVTGVDAVDGCDNLALRVARDRVLLMTAGTHGLDDGWHDDGYSVSVIDDGLVCLEIGGDHGSVLSACMNTVPERDGRSAAVRFNGRNAVLARMTDRAWLLLETALISYHWSMITESVTKMNGE